MRRAGARAGGRRPRAALALALALAVAPPAAASTPRVARERVGLCVLEAPAAWASPLARLAERAREVLPRVESDLGTRPSARYRMLLLPPGVPLDTAWIALDSTAPPWAAGYLVPEERVGAIRVARASQYPYGTLESVLAHETAHQLLHDAIPHPFPRWFDEGVATAEGRRWSAQDAVVVSASLLTTSLPALPELDSLFTGSEAEARLAYAASFSFVSWATARHGDGFIRQVVRAARDRPLSEAWRVVAGVPLYVDESAWHRSSMLRYRWVPLVGASGTLWILITLLGLWAGARRRARSLATRRRWEEEERMSGPEEDAPWRGGGPPSDP